MSKRYTLNLAAHMAECDANYVRMMRLFPEVREHDSTLFGVQVGELATEVRMEVRERGPYTTLVRLAQLPESRWGTTPSITVRMYHDARSAEVVEYQQQRRFQATYDYPNTRMRARDEKVQVNQVLGEFLSQCLTHGVCVNPRLLVTQS